MAYIPASNGRVNLAADDIITGVVLEREIQNGVKVRPTNVTATIASSTTAGAQQDIILLHNGPKGGFSQSGFSLGAGMHDVNSVVKGILTQ